MKFDSDKTCRHIRPCHPHAVTTTVGWQDWERGILQQIYMNKFGVCGTASRTTKCCNHGCRMYTSHYEICMTYSARDGVSNNNNNNEIFIVREPRT